MMKETAEKMRKMARERGGELDARKLRLPGSLALALVISIIFLAAASGGADRAAVDRSLAQSLAPGQAQSEALDSQAIVSRAVEQRFNIQLVETTYPGEIPYSDVWILNDPFLPLMGEVGALIDNDGTLDSKLGIMLDRNLDESAAATSAPASTPSSSVPTTASVSGQAVLVEDIYENRGIMYAKVKVGDISYDRIKAGVTFADNYKIVEFKSADTLMLMCGDESYELKKGQLRRI
jgi:hypothetical protein